MLIRNPKRWEIAEREATPERVFLNRRQLVAAMGLGAIATGVPSVASAGLYDKIFGKKGEPIQVPETPTDNLYPAQRNLKYATLDRDLTPEDVNAKYNNFYEFGSDKGIWDRAQALQVRPWMVTFDGMVEAEKTVDIDDLMHALPLEERLYRHRCVEAWSMTIPWTGFPMRALLDYAKPLSGTKFVRMETFNDPHVAAGQNQSWYPWPYVEGVTMAEAANDLAFLATGTYGHPMLKQHGAPLRLALPWKYGFKSVKSIVRFTFTDEQPVGYWQQLQSKEYGFWANVNPKVHHPRWSQATERVLQTGNRVETLLYNGYGEEVAGLYKDMENAGGRALFF